jgi:segregation and condensation protein A
LEYRQFKDASARLEAAADRHALRFSRLAPASITAAGAPAVRAVELWDLVSAFARLLRETQSAQPQSIVTDDTPQHIYEERILQALAMGDEVEFDDLFERPFVKMRVIGIFLALLELIKSGRVSLIQFIPYGPVQIRIVERNASPR